jgi:Domain of unknown function (DUF4332)
MLNLSRIPDISDTSLELLEAAGFSDIEVLAQAGIDELTKELERANRVLKIAENAPSRESISNWISHAQTLAPDRVAKIEEHTSAEPCLPSNFEDSAEGKALLGNAPLAIPLPAHLLVEQQFTATDIPSAILFNQCLGDLEIRVRDRHTTSSKQSSPNRSLGNIKIAENHLNRLQIDPTKVKPTETLAGKAPCTSSTGPVIKDERVALIRTPRAATNRGIDPKSRRFVRGVLHNHPIKLASGAILTLLLAFFLPAAILSGLLLFCSSEIPQYFSWVPKWLLIFPIGLPILGIAYLIWGINGSCRVCGQKLFVPRMCLKNKKAHHLYGLGYIIPVCIHMLLFKWFRCIYCATPIRLKE